MNVKAIASVVALSSVLVSSTAIAQQRHIVDSVNMNRAIANATATDQENRDAVRGLLQRDQVRDVANRLGLDVKKAEAAVGSLSSVELAKVAADARTAEKELAGGDVVIISVTTLLLIVIIIILLAK